MKQQQTKEYYLKSFEKQLAKSKTKHESPLLYSYMQEQFEQLDCLLRKISEDTFWETIPLVLGIDAKLSLLTGAMHLDLFTEEEFIRVIEQDYRTYYKELCGYDLSMTPPHSLVFNV